MDTGAAISIISDQTQRSLFPDLQLRKSRLVLKTYTDELMTVVGQLNVRVTYGSQEQKLIVVVIGGNGSSFSTGNRLEKIASVQATRSESMSTLTEQHRQLFSYKLVIITSYKVKLQVRPEAAPRFYKTCPVPFAIRASIGKELDLLAKQGIIEEVSHSNCAAPIISVPKKDCRFRICGNYKITADQPLTVEQYPLPRPDQPLATLAGGKRFSKLDLSQAYLQVPLDEDSLCYVTVNTYQGVHCYTRLPFGVASAPTLFQKVMDTVLQGIAGVACYIDDIIISAKDERQLLQTLEEVFQRLEEHGFRLKEHKCIFLTDSLEYFVHLVDQEGIHPSPSKVAAIVQAHKPTDMFGSYRPSSGW